MNHTDILKAAKAITSGGKPAITAKQLEDALLSLGTTHKRADETREACFARLVRENDADAVLLAKAADQLRCVEQNQQPTTERTTAKRRLVDSANDQLDAHVALHKRDGETTAAAHARLVRESEPGFVAIWNQLRAVQDDL